MKKFAPAVMVILMLTCALMLTAPTAVADREPMSCGGLGEASDSPDNYPSYGDKSDSPDNYPSYGEKSDGPDNYPSYGDK